MKLMITHNGILDILSEYKDEKSSMVNESYLAYTLCPGVSISKSAWKKLSKLEQTKESGPARIYELVEIDIDSTDMYVFSIP